MANFTFEELLPSPQEIQAACDFADYFDATGEFARLLELAATKPESALQCSLSWMASARSLLHAIAGMDEKEKAHFLYRQNHLVRDFVEERLLEGNWAIVLDHDADPAEFVKGLSTLDTTGIPQVDWARLKKQTAPIEDIYQALEGISTFLHSCGLTISRLRDDANDICIVVSNAKFPEIQRAAKCGRLFDLVAA